MIVSILRRQAAALLRIIFDHVTDDPVVFLMQTSRRSPAGLRLAIGSALNRMPGPTMKASSAWLRGDHEAALRYVHARPHTARQAHVLGELALSLGDRSLAVQRANINCGSPSALRLMARAEAYAGRMSRAADIAPPGRARTRLASELRTFQPDWFPSPEMKVIAPTPRRVRRSEVLFALTNSLPYTQSGYTLRTHSVMQAVQDSGVRVVGVNRTGYPNSIGKLVARDRATVDAIDYLLDIPARVARTPEARLGQQASFLKRVAQESGANCIHTTTHFTNGLATQAAAASLSLPWIYEVRGSLEDTWASSRGDDEVIARQSERYKLFRARESQVALGADHVVTLGQTMAKQLMERGIRREKILIAPNSVGKEILDSDWTVEPAGVRSQLGLPEQGVWVGTAASIVGYEGLDVLVDAAVIARQAGTDIRLLIVGDGTELPALRRRARTLGANVIFTGRMASQSARKHVQAMDVFVVPRRNVSVCRTITPLKPVEAGGLGRAVVLSDLPALTEALPTAAQKTVTPDSSEHLAAVLTSLAGDRDERERLGKSAREYVEENRTWASVGMAYRQMYEGLGISIKGVGR